MYAEMQDRHRLGNLEGRIKDARGRREIRFKVEWGSLEEEESEEDWCIRHNLSLSALRVVADTGISVVESDVRMHTNLSWQQMVCELVPSFVQCKQCLLNYCRISNVSFQYVQRSSAKSMTSC